MPVVDPSKLVKLQDAPEYVRNVSSHGVILLFFSSISHTQDRSAYLLMWWVYI